MKKYFLILISILIVLVVIIGFLIAGQKKQPQPVVPVIQIKEEVVTPVKHEQKSAPKTPMMRDENDMPKSDINVPEIG